MGQFVVPREGPEMTLDPLRYKPPTHVYRLPSMQPCGALISEAGKEDRTCAVEFLRQAANQRCPECAGRRKAAALTLRYAKAKLDRAKRRAA